MEIFRTSADGKYRVRLNADPTAVDPRKDYDHITHVITPKGQRFIDVDEDGGPLQYGWDYFAERDNSVALFTRWARMAHGAVVHEDRPHDGPRALWYMTPEQIKEIGNTPAEAIAIEIQEYRSWTEGDVWGVVTEKRVTWQQTGTSEDNVMHTWDEVESCWGLIGREYAEQYAAEGFGPYDEVAA
jgi:hypothetical protein